MRLWVPRKSIWSGSRSIIFEDDLGITRIYPYSHYSNVSLGDFDWLKSNRKIIPLNAVTVVLNSMETEELKGIYQRTLSWMRSVNIGIKKPLTSPGGS